MAHAHTPPHHPEQTPSNDRSKREAVRDRAVEGRRRCNASRPLMPPDPNLHASCVRYGKQMDTTRQACARISRSLTAWFPSAGKGFIV